MDSWSHTPPPEDTQSREDTERTEKTADKKNDLWGDRETCLARVTAAACVAFHIICLSYSIHSPLHRLPDPSIPLPYYPLPPPTPGTTYLFVYARM